MPEPKPIRHQCGLLGVRVGEASNPGPPSSPRNRRHRSRSRKGARDSQWVVSSDDEPLVERPVAPTDRDIMSTALSSTVPASSRALARSQSVSRMVEDGSDDERASIGRDVWARVGDSHREPQDMQVEGVVGNASQCPVVIHRNVRVDQTGPTAVALDADDTESVVSRCSVRSGVGDDELGRTLAVRRRLRLVWDPEQNAEVRAAVKTIRSLADRVGPTPRGSILPGVIRRQRWSVMYVPLMWAAAGQAASCPLLESLVLVTSAVPEPVTLFGGEMPVSVAARVGWESFQHAMRSWSINSEEDLSALFGRSGFPATRPGNHIPGRAQEHIVTVPVGMCVRGVAVGCKHQQKPPGRQDEGDRDSFRNPPHQLGRHGRSESGRGLLVPNTNVEKLPRISSRTFPPQSVRCSSGKMQSTIGRGHSGGKEGLVGVRFCPGHVASQTQRVQKSWQRGARGTGQHVWPRGVERSVGKHAGGAPSSTS